MPTQFEVGTFNLNLANRLQVPSGDVTQITTISTGVEINAARGAITTVDPALAAAGEAEFVVTNSYCHLDSVVVVSVRSGPADGEHIIAAVTAVTEGTFSIVLTNLAAANQGDGVMIINFLVL